MKRQCLQYLDANAEQLNDWAGQLYYFAEEAGAEVRSAALLADVLERFGFFVECGLGSQPTAFRASWGSGKPVICFIAEYDALPGLHQGDGYYYNGNGQAGHGCGHNLLGVGGVGAALALKSALEQNGGQGTVMLYGTPAEETLQGKRRLLDEGFFTEPDVVLTWHPLAENKCGEMSHKSMYSLKFLFSGRTAHASVCPEQGRSALDACELTNIGVNYLREHVPTHVRMHYSYCGEQGAPNIVPEKAALWYFLRARDRLVCDEVLERVSNIAKGAAWMTGTTVERIILNSTDETLVNCTLSKLAYENMCKIGAPHYDCEELAFVRRLAEQAGVAGLKPEITRSITPPDGVVKEEPGSTDLSVVSQAIPTLEINTACFAVGTPGHHWTVTAQAKTSAACKGMLFAAKTMVATAVDLLENPMLLQKAAEEFAARKRQDR